MEHLSPLRSEARGRRPLVLAVAALVLLILAAFSPVWQNDFVGADDETYITGNAVVRQGLTPGGILLALTRSYGGNWHPLTWFSHMLDVTLFGLDPRGHHVVSLALHAASAALLLVLLFHMTGRLGASFAVAALFAVHPLRVESVAWAAERKDVLCGLFWMLTMAMYLRYARRPGPGRLLPVVGCFALALMAKPMAVTLPLVLLIIDWWPLNRFSPTGPRLSALLAEKTPLVLLAVIAGLVTFRAQAADSAVASLQALLLASRLANAFVSLATYLAKTAVPVKLAVYYPAVPRQLWDTGVLGAAALVLAATLVAARRRRRAPWLLAGWGWYLVTILPVLGLVQVGGQALADRYTYLPLIGVLLALVWSCAVFSTGQVAATAARATAVAAICACAVLTARQTGFWRDAETLYGRALAVTGDNQWATYNLGLAREAHGDLEGAIRLYREVVRLGPAPNARYSLALLLDARGAAGEAVAELRAALLEAPDDPFIRWTLAEFLVRDGSEEEAIAQLRELVRRRPNRPEYAARLDALLAGRKDASR